MLSTGLQLFGVGDNVKPIVIGTVIVLAVVLDAYRDRFLRVIETRDKWARYCCLWISRCDKVQGRIGISPDAIASELARSILELMRQSGNPSGLASFLFLICKHLAEKRWRFCLWRRPNMGEVTSGVRPPVEEQPMSGLIGRGEILK